MDSQTPGAQNIIIFVLASIVIVFGGLNSAYLLQKDQPEDQKQIGLGVLITTAIICVIIVLLALWFLVPSIREILKFILRLSPYLLMLAGVIFIYVLMFRDFDKEQLNTIQKRMTIILGLSVPILIGAFATLYMLIQVDPANTYYPFLYGMLFFNSLASTMALSATYLGKSL